MNYYYHHYKDKKYENMEIFFSQEFVRAFRIPKLLIRKLQHF